MVEIASACYEKMFEKLEEKTRDLLLTKYISKFTFVGCYKDNIFKNGKGKGAQIVILAMISNETEEYHNKFQDIQEMSENEELECIGPFIKPRKSFNLPVDQSSYNLYLKQY